MSKTILNITVDKDVLERFKKLCGKKDIKVSTKTNTLIKEWVENNNEET